MVSSPGSRSENSGYDPNAFAIGASFLFALAVSRLATLSFRLRWMRQKTSQDPLHNEALADPQLGLQEPSSASAAVRIAGRPIVLRDSDGCITFVNDAYCELTQQPRSALIGSASRLNA